MSCVCELSLGQVIPETCTYIQQLTSKAKWPNFGHSLALSSD